MEKRYSIGIADFSAMFELSGDRVTLSISVSKGRKFPVIMKETFLMHEVDNALSALISRWDDFSGPYAGSETSEYSTSFNNLFGRISFPSLFSRSGVRFEVEFGDVTYMPGPESLIIVEVFLTIGELLSRHASDKVRSEWASCRKRTTLPPFMPWDVSLDLGRSDFPDLETEWYARGLGQDLETYKSAAKVMLLRQYAFACGLPGFSEPTAQEHDARHIPSEWMGMNEPASEVLNEVLRKLDMSVDDFIADSIASRNLNARQILVWDRFASQFATHE